MSGSPLYKSNWTNGGGGARGNSRAQKWVFHWSSGLQVSFWTAKLNSECISEKHGPMFDN